MLTVCMIRLDIFVHLMIKRTAVTSACNGRWRNRRSSAIRTLVAETLVLAKTHGYVEKIEDELERELQRDFSDPPQEKILRWRRTGDKICKSKHMLLIVVILCIVDCALVLGELALDLYKVKATLENSEVLVGTTKTFLSEMSEEHPHLYEINPSEVFSMILNATVIWNASINETRVANISSAPYIPCNAPETTSNSTLFFTSPTTSTRNKTSQLLGHKTTMLHYDVEIVGKIAQVFHYSSIGILALIMIETFLKAVCAGKSFFRRKIEVFDAFVVVMSFLMDFTFLVFLHDIATKDFVFILAILLPWRVIRVVNSLIVSVKDHEHFRLKLVYKRKKKIQGNLRDAELMLQKYISQATALQRLCIMEGIEEWKIDKYLKNEDSVPPTPQKRKFKFKLDDSLFQGHNRAPRCSMPVLDFHGLKLPSSSKPKMSFSSVSNSIKHHISKSLQSKRSPLASSESFNAHVSNGEIQRRKKRASEDLCTMHEEESENDESIESSRATSESGDVFSRVSTSGSVGSEKVCAGVKTLSRNSSDSADDELLKMAKIKEDAKRRHSESTISKGNRAVNLSDLVDTITFASPSGKIITKPYKPCGTSSNATASQPLENKKSDSLSEVKTDKYYDKDMPEKTKHGMVKNNNEEKEEANVSKQDSNVNEMIERAVGDTCTSDKVFIETELSNGTVYKHDEI